MWLCERYDKAREYVDRMLKLSPSSKDGLTLRGWIDLSCGRESLMKRSIKYFDDALEGWVWFERVAEVGMGWVGVIWKFPPTPSK